MSDTEQDDAKRRQRARFVDALTKTAQQPGGRSRVGTKVAGAAAVLALAAGATLGFGAWRSYQSDQDAKEHLAAEKAAQQRRIVPSAPPASPSASEEHKKEKKTAPAKRPAAGAGGGGGAAVHDVPLVETESSHSPRAKAKSKPKKPARGTVDKLLSAGHSRVLLKNAKSGMCADVTGYDGGRPDDSIMQYYCDGTSNDNQVWSLVVRGAGKGPGGSDLVSFVNIKDGLCLDLPGYAGLPAGWGAVEGTCNTATPDNQQWWLDPAGGGTVRVRNRASDNLCLEVKDDSTERAAQLQLDKCGTDADSRWTVLS